ncbi:GON-4-like protein isoform X1 [Python bivittatus]|uniref:GON-4-like protein n=1 Tax=Python bivittatus TaxID=176946 RepID=A0A9F2WCZ6_PYTBI|nr:GON-4-like protein isoform X1 [Python bivittatus]
MSLSPTMLPCKKRKAIRMDPFSEAQPVPMEASPSACPLLPKPETEWEEGEVSPNVKFPGATQSVDSLQEVKEEAEEMGLFIPVEEREGGKKNRRKTLKRKWEGKCPEEDGGGGGGGRTLACDLKLDDTLDRTLEDGAKQHNLTAVNVRNILHEVITNEHVVAMMKAAITETEDAPVFEPKMTRSKLKEVVEKGVVIPTWNISPIKKANEVKPPQFVDIPLEDDDSSDEEYQPEEDEGDETAEESLLESDVESTASSPRGAKRSRSRQSDMVETDEEGVAPLEAEKGSTPPVQRHVSAEVIPMGPPPPPKPKQNKDSTFMEKLHAVDEELASSPVCMEAYQPLEDSLIAFRTRSKRPLKDVPLGQLEAELRAPDITPDMYDPNTADDEEWKRWLSGLMNDNMENEDEADDEDDPEYNFLEDLDEPDTEDFRNDRAVRITKKEVNELMEELFETFQDEIGFSNVEDDGPEDEDGAAEARPNFNTPQVLRFEEPLANLLNEQHRTVKEQLEQLRVKKSATKLPQEMERSKLRSEKVAQALVLDAEQRKKLHQQMQQHVQLLTQIHLLSSCNPSLSSEGSTTRLFLNELDNFAQSSVLLSQTSSPRFQTAFQPCNLKESLQLIKDFHTHVKIEWSPRKAVKKNMNDFACLPKQVAWILATRRVFMYPELMPTCSLKAKTPRDKIVFTKGEDNLLALGLKHFEGTDFPKPLISKYLLTTKTAHQLTGRIKNRNMNRVPDNIIRYYKTTKQLPVLPRLCEEVQPGDWKPPVEQEEHRLPFWLKASLPSIQEALEQQRVKEVSQGPDADPKLREGGRETAGPASPEYPLRVPEGLQLILRPLSSRFCRKIWRWQRPAPTKPFLVQPGLCLPPAGTGSFLKMATKQPQPEAAPGKLAGHVSPLSQPASLVQPLSGVPRLNLPPALGSGAPFELQGVLSAQRSGPKPCLVPAVPQNLVSSLPVAFQPKMILPALPASRVRKPALPRGYQKKKTPRVAPLLKAAPVLHPTPVIFTVPAGTVKVLGITNGCNMLQPLSATSAVQATQSIPITTLLVNPTPFSCPLNQPLAASPALPLVVASNSGSSPAPVAGKDSELSSQPISRLASGGDVLEPVKAKPKTEPEEPPGPWSSDLNGGVQAEARVQGYAEGGEGRTPELLAPAPFSPLAELGELVKVDLEGSREAPPEAAPLPKKPGPEDSPIKEELILDLGQGLEVKPASECRKEPKETQSQPGCEEEEEEEEETANSGAPATGLQAAASAEEGSSTSPTNVGSSVAAASDSSSSSGKTEEVAGPGTGTEGVVSASQEAGGEKDGLEEEEEEDFDDYIQDEEDEMSSASEESVLSVPELQETMEKLTWLASERRLSQEGDSEEENSQEENSEPEEEEEEEEEGEGEHLENQQKEDEMADETADPGDRPASSLALTCAAPTVEASNSPPGENPKAASKSRASHRARAKRGRTRASKDASKLLLLYDDDILERDPLREQKDFAFAQAYLNRVREALRLVPGKYEEFLRNIYEFESNLQKQTAVDLYARLQSLLQDWPQLLTDFAAFLLPEQALECGLFEEQQAFEKSRTFLRRLEICFAENPSHHQKIIKVLQNCADCVPQEIMELKNQMWQLLKGHDHLQDEFSVFFDHLRPSASRLGDFEEINWTEEKEYEFDGFEEVSLPDMEEDEDPPKIHAASKNKRRKELGSQNTDKEAEWPEGNKEWCSSCHENSGDLRLKRSKRRSCAHCCSKVGDTKLSRNKDLCEFADSRAQREPSPRLEGKEPPEGNLERREEGDVIPSRLRATGRKGDSAGGGSRLEGKLLSSKDPPLDVGLSSAGKPAEPCPLPAPPCPQNGVDSAKSSPAPPVDTPLPPRGAVLPKPHRLKSSCYTSDSEREVGLSPRTGEHSSGPNRDSLETEALSRTAGPDPSSPPQLGGTLAPARPSLKESHGLPPLVTAKSKGREMSSAPTRDLALKTLGASEALQTDAEISGTGSMHTLATNQTGKAVSGASDHSQKEDQSVPVAVSGDRSGPVLGEDLQPRTVEPTVCAKNIKVSSTGEKVVLWTREADRVILTTCQERGAHPQTFSAISEQLRNKTPDEVAHRFWELMTLFHTACDVSSEDEEDGMSTSNTDQLSDKDPAISEDEREDQGF